MYTNPNTSKVIVDDYVGAKEVVNHLIEQGCKRIALLEGTPGLMISVDRKRGYIDALAENKIAFDENLVIPCPEATLEDGKEAAEKLLALKDQPDGIFATSDPMAMGAITVLREKGIKIPADIAVAGFSNWFYGQLMEPSLTTVDQPGFEMGQEAARLLIRQIEMKDKDLFDIQPETKTLKTRLIIRNSSLRKKPKKN
jgi:LacI family transcriptional regulator